jgi:plastocyanin
MKTHRLPRLFGLALLLMSNVSGWGATHLVFVDDSGFSPDTLNISAGDTVVWFNDDEFFPHTTTSDLTPLEADYWNALLVDYLDSYSKTFNRPGRFTYHDEVGDGLGTIIVGGANPPPVVTITQPAANSTFSAPASFDIVAQASDANGILAVEFLVDEASVGLVFSEPYSASVSDLPVGPHTIAVVASDTLGAQSTNSISIEVVLDQIRLVNARMSGASFLVDATGLTPGKTNHLQFSPDLTTWTSVRTNVATASTASFTNSGTFSRGFYRVRRLP